MKRRAKILVVDDDRGMVKTVCDILKINGYETDASYSGEGAVEKVQSQMPDCVLMDIKMPGISGIDALKIIKGEFPHMPVVLMSGFAMVEQVEESMKNGAYAVLAKPVEVDKLLVIVEEIGLRILHSAP